MCSGFEDFRSIVRNYLQRSDTPIYRVPMGLPSPYCAFHIQSIDGLAFCLCQDREILHPSQAYVGFLAVLIC